MTTPTTRPDPTTADSLRAPVSPAAAAAAAPLLDLVAAGVADHGSTVQAIVDVWMAHDVPDVRAFLVGAAQRFELSPAQARRLAQRLPAPWAKATSRPR